MSLQNDVEYFLKQGASECWTEFMKEIDTEENKDYRRGFKAGLLCSHLYIKSQVSNIRDEYLNTEQIHSPE